MRFVLLSVLVLVCVNGAMASDRFAGFITFGCNDSYIKLPGVQGTWFVDLPAKQQRRVFELADVERDKYTTWWTFHVEIDGQVEDKPRRGFFADHLKQLRVERLITARYPESGETVQAATAPARLRKGYLLVGPESVGFVPLEQSDEIWWVVPGKVGWDKMYEAFQPPPDLGKNARMDSAVVEILGRVGPPGGYGHGSEFLREVEVDGFTYIRSATPEEMVGTAAVVDVDAPNSSVPRINRCLSPRP